MMLVHLPLLAAAAAAMFVAAILLDLVRPLIIREAGTQPLRWPDVVLVNLLFFCVTPGMLYAWSYPLVPFSGFRAGLFMAAALFVLAVAPTFAVYRLDVADKSRATLGHLFWILLKYLLVYGLLTGIYKP
jgi:hypothetical protein